MESNLVNFTELQPLMDNWTAIVQVIEKQKVQVSRNGKRYQKLVFVDSQGQTAQALIYAGDIMFFRKYFEPYRRYYVSNARIQNVLPRYSTYPNECSWTIDNSTLVQEIDEVDPPLIPNVFNFANYNSVYQHIDTTDEIDLIGIAIHVHSKAIRGGTPTRDIILKDHTSHPMVLTLWGEHESEEGQDIADMIHTQPVVAALRVRVTSYHTMHLSTKYSSSILINPPIQQATGLRNWCSQNQEEITRFIAERTYTDRLKLLPIPDDDRVITISDLTAVAEARPYWIRGIPKLLETSQKLWYHSCPHCYKYIRARPDYEITCTSCYQRIRLTPRCRLTVQISDMSGAITLDLSGNDAEQLLPFGISDIQKQEQQGNVHYATIADFINHKNLVCVVKKSNTIHSSRSSEEYNAIVAHINNATAAENYVISKYITNYKATASTWGAAQEEHSKKIVTDMAEDMAIEKVDSIMEGDAQSKGVDQLSPSNTVDKKKKAAVAAAPMKLRVNPTKKHRT